MIARFFGTAAVVAGMVGGTAAAAQEQGLPVVRLGLLQYGTVNWEAQTIIEEGLDEKHGFDLEIVPFAGGDATKVALMAGHVDVTTDDWLMVSRQRAMGDPLVFIPYSTSIGAVMAPCDGDIQSLEDLEGKRVSVGAPGSGTEVNAQTLLEANGMSFDDFTAQRLNFNETADALANGDVDAGFWSVGAPTSSILNLATTQDIRMIPLTDEQVAAAQEADPTFTELSLPSGTYEGVEEDISTIGVPNVLVVSSEMDEETVYQITKAMYENIEELRAVHPAAEETTVEFTMSATPVPLHAGAIRYFEETGADIPDDLRE